MPSYNLHARNLVCLASTHVNNGVGCIYGYLHTTMESVVSCFEATNA